MIREMIFGLILYLPHAGTAYATSNFKDKMDSAMFQNFQLVTIKSRRIVNEITQKDENFFTPFVL